MTILNISSMVQGDNLRNFPFKVRGENGKVDLTGANVEVYLQSPTKVFSKVATITDELHGLCEIVLTSDDISEIGDYQFQSKINFSDGRVFQSSIRKFKVEPSISSFDVTIDGGTFNVSSSNSTLDGGEF